MADIAEYPVILSEAAIADLSLIGRWISKRAGVDIAETYVARVESACYRLAHFPNRGTQRFDVSPGLRSVAFERRVIIAYRVENNEVRIVRLIDAARDFAMVFRNA